LRIELGLTADDLSKMLGKNRATIYRYENGDIENLPTSVLESLSKALNTTPAYLLGWGNQEKHSPLYVPNDRDKIIKSIMELDDNEIIELEKTLDYLIWKKEQELGLK